MMAAGVAISEHVDFTDILIEDGWAASVLSKTECESERITEWINRGNGYDSSGIIYVVAGNSGTNTLRQITE
jgi:hypothetical protein